MGSDYLSSIYDRMGRQLDPDETYFVRDSRFIELERQLRTVPSGRFLDIGCGRGLLLRRLRDHHLGVGCDFDPGAVTTCQEAGLDVQQADMNTAVSLEGLEEKSFDAIVISEVCEHLLNPRSALRLAKRYLAPNGTLIVTVPNAVPLLVRWPVLLGRRVNWLHYPSGETEVTGHIRFYTIDSMTDLLRSEGLSVDLVRGVSFRMNGIFWGRICYWLPRLMGRKEDDAPTQVDAWLGERFPGLAPGLVFSCKARGEDVRHA